MKYSYGVPAWLGALKVSLILFGLPALVAVFLAPVVGRWLGLSQIAEVAVYFTMILLGGSLILTIAVLRSRRAAGKKSDS